jgi:hypothetical protein
LQDLADPVRPRISWAAVVALLGSLGVLLGVFLPWFDLPQEEREQFVLNRSQLDRWERDAVAKGRDTVAVARGREWLTGGTLHGWGWLSVSDVALDHADEQGVEAREVRAWRAAIAAGRALPFVAGLLALVLVLGRLRPMTSGVLASSLLVALCVAAIAALVATGASPSAREALGKTPRVLGLGGLLFLGSGAVLALAALLGGTWRARWRGWALAVALAVLAVLATGIYVAG